MDVDKLMKDASDEFRLAFHKRQTLSKFIKPEDIKQAKKKGTGLDRHMNESYSNTGKYRR